MTSGPYRLPAPAGSLIDRARVIEFSFEGRAYQGLAGDTVASALLANGVWMLSRSFKYRRPRGPLSLSEEEASTLVQIGAEPNVPADIREIEAGMHIRGQNYVGSLRRDRLAILGRLGRFLPVGFYYKAFYKPRGAWNWWEKIIRRTAGLGQVEQPGQQLAPGQVAGCAEQHDDVRLERGDQVRPDVGGVVVRAQDGHGPPRSGPGVAGALPHCDRTVNIEAVEAPRIPPDGDEIRTPKKARTAWDEQVEV